MKIIISIVSDELGDVKVSSPEVDERGKVSEIKAELAELLAETVSSARRAYDIEPAF